MSCNGCRVLRKGCNDKCILRQSLSGIDSSQAQSNATVFVAKFFGRAGLMSFLSSVPDSQRPALFQSLLFEACGRTVNPVSGAVGLLWTGNWHVCQSAVETVLRGGLLHSIPELSGVAPPLSSGHLSSGTNTTVNIDFFRSSTDNSSRVDLDFSRNNFAGINGQDYALAGADLDLCLTPRRQSFTGRLTANGRPEKRRAATPNSEESETTTFDSSVAAVAYNQRQGEDTKLLRLFF